MDILKMMKKALMKKVVLLLMSKVGLIFIALVGLIFIIMIAVVGVDNDDSIDESFDFEEMGGGSLSPHIQKYKPIVQKYAKKEGIEKYVPIILGMMQQESGGNPDVKDPMQSSESKCGTIGCITDPNESIKQGVKYFKSVLDKANGDVLLAVASYNMGEGFISYFHNKKGKDKKYTLNKVINGKKTSKEIISFSQQQYKKNPSIYNCSRAEGGELNACHGDIMYVDSILYYADNSSGEGVNVKGDITFPVPHTSNITSKFDPNRKHPNTGKIQPHNGFDVAGGNDYGKQIVSIKKGKVVHAQMTGTAGNMVRIEHSGGMTSVYMHLSKINVRKGQEIKAGTKIGEMGNTGDVSPPPSSQNPHAGTHLHFEIRINGNAVNPEKFFK